jgi:hypothetical protein
MPVMLGGPGRSGSAIVAEFVAGLSNVGNFALLVLA